MGVLTEYVRKEAEGLKKEREQRAQLVTEWTVAINWLYNRFEQWLRAADGGTGVLTSLQAAGSPQQELLLGAYSVPVLRVFLGGGHRRWAEVMPRARFVAGTIKTPGDSGKERRADGMVEIRNDRFTTDYLFRVAGATVETDQWYIRDVDGWNSDPEYGRVEELTRERFEAAVLRALG